MKIQEAGRSSPVEKIMDTIMETQQSAFGALDALEKQLAFLMVPKGPNEAEDKIGPDRQPESALLRELREIAEGNERLYLRLSRIRERLQV